MTKKLFLAGAAALSLAAAPQAAHAVSIATTNEASGNLPGYTTATVFQNFNGATNVAPSNSAISYNGTTITPSQTGTNRVLNGNVLFQGAAPFGSTFGNYLSIGSGIATAGSYKLSFTGTAVHFLSFIVGSLDVTNQVTLNLLDSNNVASVLTLSGNQILTGNDASSPIPLSNGSTRVSYNFGSSSVSAITFSNNTLLPFEIDEIALAAPEPSTWAMMLLGFGLVGSQLRRRTRKPAKVLATA